MKTIKEVTKKPKIFQVYIDEEMISVEPEVYFRYHLKPGLELESSTYLALIQDNEYAYYFRIGIEKLKKMMTKKELSDYLLSKGAKTAMVHQLISLFEQRKYLDDYSYAKTYFSLKERTEGPDMIQNKLREKGVSQTIISGFIENYNEDEILADLVGKKLKSIHNKSKKQAIQTTKSYFISKGFSMDAIDRNIKNNLHLFQTDELLLIQKEYQKLLKKYQEKMEAHELKYFLTQKLYQKGFSIEDIHKVLA